MSDTLSVARRDFTDARRSKLLWGVLAIYVGFEALVFYASSTGTDPQVDLALFGAMFLTALLLPVVAVAASYLAVVGERESNTIRFLLGLPTSRSSVVLGKFLSRTAIVLLALGAAFLVGAAMALTLYPDPSLGLFVGFGLLTTLFVGAYVGTTVGISAAATSRTQAISLAVGFYFVTDVLWVFGDFSVIGALRFLFEDTLGLSLAENFYRFVYQLSPTGAYLNTEYLLFDPAKFPQLPPQTADAFYLQPWFSVLVLAAWVVVPLAVGYWVFEGAEIG